MFTLKSISEHSGRDYGKTNMRGLHACFGFDFKKPYKTISDNGKFTLGAIKKELAASGYTTDNSTIVVIMGTHWHECTRVTDSGIDIDVPWAVDSYDRKRDFENDRKSGCYDYLVVAQHTEHLIDPPIDRLHFATQNAKSANFDYRTDRVNYDKLREWESIYYDKSGYKVEIFRNTLLEKVKAIRADKLKAEYLKVDHTAQVKTLYDLVLRLRDKLADELRTVTTYEQADAFSEKLSYWRGGLTDIFEDFEEFKTNTEEQTFKSLKESNALFDRITHNIYKYL